MKSGPLLLRLDGEHLTWSRPLSFDPTLAERRFGYGLSPVVAPVASVAAMLDGVAGQDTMRARYPLPPYRHLREQLVRNRRFRQYARENPDTEEGKAAEQKVKALRREMRLDRLAWFGHSMLRRINTPAAFHERLAAFWADHFTTIGKAGLTVGAPPLYVEEAVRPFIAWRFADLLISAVTHPLMLHYLDQNISAGENSPAAQRPGRKRGLNENLAREVLELHTLGVEGPYDQADVRVFANLLTGLGGTRDFGFRFRKNMVEPGSKTVLGVTYPHTGTIEPIHRALKDLAVHPSTARHLARKLAVHFVSDAPPDALIDHVASAYLSSDGELMATYEALLTHPAAWQPEAVNIRPPLEFISTALRSLAVPEARFAALRPRDLNALFLKPLRVMGFEYQRPGGPDGWPEEDDAWVTPQGVAARLEWAVNAPVRLLSDLPDPREFVVKALGEVVPPELGFAVDAAENRAVAIGLVLASPAMQRR